MCFEDNKLPQVIVHLNHTYNMQVCARCYKRYLDVLVNLCLMELTVS